MDLDEFVRLALVNVLSGIREAQEEAHVGAFVVPGNDGGHRYPEHPRVSNGARLKSTIIDFDVAVTVESSGKSSRGGSLKIAGLGGNLQGESSTKDTVVSRIQFGVPILLPENRRSWYKELTEKEDV